MKKIYDEDIWKINKFIYTEIIELVMKKYYRNKRILEKEKMKIYLIEYFYPYYWTDKYTDDCITENTYAIHRWEESWMVNPNIVYLQYKHQNPIKRFFKIRKKIKRLRKNKVDYL